MEGAQLPDRGPRLLFSFNTATEVDETVKGCDGDIGGFSTVNFSLDSESESERIGRPTGKFSGHMRLDVRPELVGRINSGYAGFKTPVRSTFFGKITDNVYFHDYLALRVRAAGDPILHKSYFVNVQTVDQMRSVQVWQQALPIRRYDNDWETVYLPFTKFLPFTIGEPSPYPEPIDRENILTVGISLLGGKHGVSGAYELGVDSIWAANEGDLQEDSPGPNTCQ
ncbi:NADH:ubiquinone oxidoreductase intermediate-associated protein 30 [Roridomyces roridus]|uniref:NADH:ubiquinone oxidoreductase intermediate-associated protein 30 n=1 Tax=Roridomyces roridus TaxID=1738132 RepID=A0AAD7CJS0_9AGAR|nr:NADH:ubiquinone oxidoreductase intermediate-associated protein 30 [Roridomyces roridus]